jgi:hypothetical protein
MILLLIALFGLIVPNGLFLYWLVYEYDGPASVAQNKLGLAFMIDALLAVVLLAYNFARKPIGNRVKRLVVAILFAVWRGDVHAPYDALARPR